MHKFRFVYKSFIFKKIRFIETSFSRLTYNFFVIADRPKPASKTAREKEKAERSRKKSVKKEDDDEDGEAKPPKRQRKEDEILERCEQDPAFMEFLQAHKKTAATWGNDTLVDELMKMKKIGTRKEEVDSEVPGETKKRKKDSSKKAGTVDDEDDSQEPKKPKTHKVEFFTLKLRDVPKKAKKKDIKAFFAPLKLKSVR